MKITDLSLGNTILNDYIAEIRDREIQTDRLRFRRNIERISEIMAYETSRELTYTPMETVTPLGTATHNRPTDNVVIATLFRAGIPMHNAFLGFYDKADNAFVSAYRKYRNESEFDIEIEYLAAPSIEGKTLIIVDPMLATGRSMLLAYDALKTHGTPAKVILASIIASRQAVEFVEQNFPNENTTLYCATVDPELNPHCYIVPGLGDAGDLCYGGKL